MPVWCFIRGKTDGQSGAVRGIVLGAVLAGYGVNQGYLHFVTKWGWTEAGCRFKVGGVERIQKEKVRAMRHFMIQTDGGQLVRVAVEDDSQLAQHFAASQAAAQHSVAAGLAWEACLEAATQHLWDDDQLSDYETATKIFEVEVRPTQGDILSDGSLLAARIDVDDVISAFESERGKVITYDQAAKWLRENARNVVDAFLHEWSVTLGAVIDYDYSDSLPDVEEEEDLHTGRDGGDERTRIGNTPDNEDELIDEAEEAADQRNQRNAGL